jgi:hypothetical protein
MDKLLVADFIYIKNKEKNMKKDKINYKIINKYNDTIIFTIKNIYIPFGIEKYNDKNLLNLELNPEKYNEHYNANIFLMQLEKELIEKQNIKDINIINAIQNKSFFSNVKKNNEKIIIRNYMIGMPDIYMKINNKKFQIFDCKNKRGNVKIEIFTLWITLDKYGILFNIKEIEILP